MKYLTCLHTYLVEFLNNSTLCAEFASTHRCLKGSDWKMMWTQVWVDLEDENGREITDTETTSEEESLTSSDKSVS